MSLSEKSLLIASGTILGVLSTLTLERYKSRSRDVCFKDGRSKGLPILPLIISTLMEKWNGSAHLSGDTGTSRKVVEYLDPDDLRSALNSDWRNHPHNPDSADLLALGETGLDTFGRDGCESLAALLRTIVGYSVDTSHPMFFNQLFGTLDPSAIAGELVSLFQNTSNYTYEACPCYSMMEREVMTVFTSLLGWDWEKSDGLMVPGGSVGNMMGLHIARHHKFPETRDGGNAVAPKITVFVSREAHYSFLKTIGLLGMGRNNLVKVDTTGHGEMCSKDLEKKIKECKAAGGCPWFIGCTAGSTVKGTFDKFDEIADIAEKHGLWMHVDGAWGGSALFSDRPDIKKLLTGISRADSVTVNPHKMLGTPLQTTVFMTRYAGLMLKSNGSEAKYLFDKRKKNAHLDIGDGTFMCGRKTDSIKIWSMWKFRGRKGIAKRVDSAVVNIDLLAQKIKAHPNFMLACSPWPFNVNFLYLPKRIREMMADANIKTDQSEAEVIFPAHIADAISTVAIKLKMRLQEKGLTMLPYQPLAGQKAQVFRVVLSGTRDDFGEREIDELMLNLVKYGDDL